MDRENHDETQRNAPDSKLQSRCDLDWKQIAEEMSKEQDGAKLIELSYRLIDAFDNQQGAA